MSTLRPPLYFPIKVDIVGTVETWETIYWRPMGDTWATRSLAVAQTEGAKASDGTDDFLIGVLDDVGDLVNIVGSGNEDLRSTYGWSDDEFPPVAEALRLDWAGVS